MPGPVSPRVALTMARQIIAAHTAEVAELSKAIKAAVKAEIKEAKKPS